MNGCATLSTFIYGPAPVILGRGQKVISKILYQNLCVFSPIKDIKHIERGFRFVAWVCPRGVTWVCWGQNFSVGICDGAPSTARSSFLMYKSKHISFE